jgi:hypothetical protein
VRRVEWHAPQAPVLRIPEFPNTWSQVSVHVSVRSMAA